MFRFVMLNGQWAGIRIDSIEQDPYYKNHLESGNVVAFCNTLEDFFKATGLKIEDINDCGLDKGHSVLPD